MKDTYKITNVHPPEKKKVKLIKRIVAITYYLLIKIEFIQSANEVTNTVNFCNKVAADTISNYNQLKQDFVNNNFNQNITNIHLDDMFTTGLRGFKESNEKTNSFIDEALIKNKNTIVQYIIAVLLESKLLDNKEQARLQMHYDFDQDDIMKDIESYFTTENESTIITE